ncbi:hypothetical protein KCT23_002328 [Enterococcus faecium]|nr:hypothetical protein [Enterococcus faecium]
MKISEGKVIRQKNTWQLIKVLLVIYLFLLFFSISTSNVKAETKDFDSKIEIDSKMGKLVSRYFLLIYGKEISDSDLISILKPEADSYEVTFQNSLGKQYTKKVSYSDLSEFKNSVVEIDSEVGKLVSRFIQSNNKKEVSDYDLISIIKTKTNYYEATYQNKFGEIYKKTVNESDLSEYKTNTDNIRFVTIVIGTAIAVTVMIVYYFSFGRFIEIG